MAEKKCGIRMTVSQFQVFDDEMAAFAAQLGIRNIQMNSPALPGDKVWSFEDLKGLRDRIESKGLKLVMIENVPLIFYDKVILGLPGRDEQLDYYCRTIRNLGALGIEVFGHHFSPTFVWRTDSQAPGRGGCKVTAFDADKMGSINTKDNGILEVMRRKRHLLDYDVFEVAAGLTADDLFKNYKYFMDAVIPVAEQCGMKLALHPDDPPVKNFNNIQRMVTSLDDYKRAKEIANSRSWGANLCLGCCSELGGSAAVHQMLDYFLENDCLFSVHLRDVQGVLPSFRECFLGEGNYNPSEVIEKLYKAGYNGFIMEDHVAHMDNDTVYGHRARAHELGYISGMIDMLNYMESR